MFLGSKAPLGEHEVNVKLGLESLELNSEYSFSVTVLNNSNYKMPETNEIT